MKNYTVSRRGYQKLLFSSHKYLNGICNVPSGLPFVDLNTRATKFSATLIVLAELTAAHTSSSNFVSKIGVMYTIN